MTEKETETRAKQDGGERNSFLSSSFMMSADLFNLQLTLDCSMYSVLWCQKYLLLKVLY